MELHQEIYLEPNPDGESYPITRSDVQIHTCRVYERARDSSKVRSRAIIDYRWEAKFYEGHLVSVHRDGTYLAYVLHSRNACNVRVINRNTKARALIKHFVGQAVDVVWSFASWPHLLAISDEGGNVVVYAIEERESTNEINVKQHLRIEGSSSVAPRQPSHRLSWCPYVPDQNAADENRRITPSPVLDDPQPDSGTGDDQVHLLAVFRGAKVDVLNVDKIVKEYGSETTFASIESGTCSREIDSEISAVAISPDATALALSSHGGEVKFYILDGSCEMSHAQSWKPHKGRAVTSIVFLDNFLAAAHSEDTFWKYVLTACDGNRELKLWSCENWECMGTLRIDPPEAQSEHTALSMTADWTSSYIFLTDIERKSLYTVEVVPSDGRVRFASFTEFPLLYPALSLAVVSAGPKRVRPSSPGVPSELDDGGEHEIGNTVSVQAFLYAVNPRSLLELDVRFIPPQRDDVNDSMLSTLSSCKLEGLRDELSDLSTDMLRAPPSVMDVAKTAGTNFLNFDDGRCRSTSSHPDSPNERTPTRELEVERRISASPSSQEVSTILANPLGGDGGPSCLMNINHTVAAAITIPSWSQSNVTAQQGDAISAAPSYAPFADGLAKMANELSRINSVITRQEDNLQHLKHLVASQQSMWEAVSHRLQDRERQGSEDVHSLQQCVDALNPDQVQQKIMRAMEEIVPMSLDSSLRGEMRNTLIPCVVETLNPLKDSIQLEVAQKLVATDAVVREQIGKLIKSKPITDAIGQAAGQAAASVAAAEANAAYRESFQKIIAPSFESTARGLFTQMNDAFQRGTKEYLDQLQRQSAVVNNNTEEWRKGVLSQLITFADQLKATSERHLSLMQSNIDKHFESLAQRLQEIVYANIRNVVRDEVAKAVADGQQALNDTVMRALRSQAPTPVPSSAPQADRQQILNEINYHLSAGRFNDAFQQALQVRDTNFVNYICQRVDPARLFSEVTCPLQQPVILSLLHQLSSDFGTNTDLKLKYMQEAVPSLDPKVLGDIGTNTLRQVYEKLGAFLQSNPGAHARRGKTVYMLLASLNIA